MKATKTQKLAFEMLTENTGSHILDSGGAYGRNHERNNKKTIEDFINESDVSFEWDDDNKEIWRTVSVFHFISHSTELDDICDHFNNMGCENWEADEDVYGVSSEQWDWLTENHEVTLHRSWNTYNGESDLSQVLQGANLEINGDVYFLIQVHGGCDVRGGYTDAKLFKAGYFCEGIHEYIWEYEDSSEIIQDFECWDEDVEIKGYFNPKETYKVKYILEQLNEIA